MRKDRKVVTAIIVTFKPNLNGLKDLIASLRNQVDEVVIINNGAQLPINKTDGDGFITIKNLGANKGIAYAQNIGILYASQNSDFIVTFDQDSKVRGNLIKALLSDYSTLTALGFKIGCIGPSVINQRTGQLYDKYFRGSKKLNESSYSVNSIISSGSLFKTEIFADVGINKSHWFIDSIDIEWCYRAKSLGYHVVMTKSITMEHNLGIHDQKLPFNRSINFGSPFRLYYVFRNWILSLKEDHFPAKYKLKILFFLPIKFAIFSLIPPRAERVKYMANGIIDGILSRFNAHTKYSTNSKPN